MRKKLWLQFHLWTIGLLTVLTIANVVSALRPFSSSATADVTGAVRLVESVSATLGRAPASETPVNSKLFLKLVQVGCEPALRLRVTDDVRQLRLQFDACPNLQPEDEVVGVFNIANGFEATVFGGSNSQIADLSAQVESDIPGTFIPSTPVKPVELAKKKKGRELASLSAAVSTDYIALKPGANEIKIHRSNRLQTLKIERR